MSTLYNVEPNPTAKCILRTTSGDLLLELFAQQIPLASRSFLQHCLDGYYNGTIFHRLVPGFIVQGGDPTGTGFGGESALDGGRPFKDEFHSRLRFNRRGLLGMANGGEKNDNGSQFFLTLGDTKDLNGKHTIFGRIAGETIYNLLKIGDAELTEAEGSERPMFPTKIIGSEVLVNPFEDMVARKQVNTSMADDDKKQSTKKRKRKPAGKQMLSFGGDDGEVDGGVALPTTKATKFNSNLVRSNDISSKEKTRVGPRPKTNAAESNAPLSSEKRSRFSPQPNDISTHTQRQPSPVASSPKSDSSDSEVEITKVQRKSKAALESTNAQIADLKQSLKRTIPLAQAGDTVGSTRRKTPLEMMMPKGAIRGRKRPGQIAGQNSGTGTSKEEQRALNLFKAFGQRLEDAATSEKSARRKNETHSPALEPKDHDMDKPAKPVPNAENNTDFDEAPLCDLHFIPNCQSCANWEANYSGESENEDDRLGLMSHTLTFAKDRLGKSLEWKRQNEEQLVVIDPREKARTIKQENKKGRTKNRDG